MPECGAVAALHDFAHLLAGQIRFPPLFFNATFDSYAIEFDGVLVAAGKPVVSANRLHAHGWSPFKLAQSGGPSASPGLKRRERRACCRGVLRGKFRGGHKPGRGVRVR